MFSKALKQKVGNPGMSLAPDSEFAQLKTSHVNPVLSAGIEAKRSATQRQALRYTVWFFLAFSNDHHAQRERERENS